MRCAWLLLIALVVAACTEDARTRDPVDGDGGRFDGGPAADTGPDADGALALDAEPDATAPDDAGARDAEPDVPFVEVDLGPPEEEVCNGEDDDHDGLIDEGVSNLCGGCGGIPPEGCQGWQVSVVQDAEGLVAPTRVVGLLIGVSGASERRIEGASCNFIRSPALDPDAHLGIVNVDSPHANLNLVPEHVPAQRRLIYANSPELGRVHVHDGGDTVAVRAGGGRLVGPFEVSAVAPAALAGVTAEDLRGVLEQARGEGDDGPVQIRWDAAEPSERGRLSLFVGGSRIIFRNVVYTGIEHYQLDANLRDDGELSVPAGFFGAGVPLSSIRVRLARERPLVRPLGPHGLLFTLGQEVVLTASGDNERNDPPPFQIVEPSPNVRLIEPGQPLTVRWSELPPGEGPLVVRLTKRDAATAVDEIYTCTVDDPAAGELVLPGDFTESWPRGAADVRQLALQWTTMSAGLPGPDQGRLTRALSVLLQLEAGEDEP